MQHAIENLFAPITNQDEIATKRNHGMGPRQFFFNLSKCIDSYTEKIGSPKMKFLCRLKKHEFPNLSDLSNVTFYGFKIKKTNR